MHTQTDGSRYFVRCENDDVIDRLQINMGKDGSMAEKAFSNLSAAHKQAADKARAAAESARAIVGNIRVVAKQIQKDHAKLAQRHQRRTSQRKRKKPETAKPKTGRGASAVPEPKSYEEAIRTLGAKIISVESSGKGPFKNLKYDKKWKGTIVHVGEVDGQPKDDQLAVEWSAEHENDIKGSHELRQWVTRENIKLDPTEVQPWKTNRWDQNLSPASLRRRLSNTTRTNKSEE